MTPEVTTRASVDFFVTGGTATSPDCSGGHDTGRR
jgi:hypothetical protein